MCNCSHSLSARLHIKHSTSNSSAMSSKETEPEPLVSLLWTRSLIVRIAHNPMSLHSNTCLYPPNYLADSNFLSLCEPSSPAQSPASQSTFLCTPSTRSKPDSKKPDSMARPRPPFLHPLLLGHPSSRPSAASMLACPRFYSVLHPQRHRSSLSTMALNARF